jgi:MHS family proline/betaine transporter-like MFS transporter
VPSTSLAELFPTRLRYNGLSLTYGLGSALFGGTAPALAAFLVRRTDTALSPAWYATVLTAAAIACVLLAPETAGRPLDVGSDRPAGQLPGGTMGRPHCSAAACCAITCNG